MLSQNFLFNLYKLKTKNKLKTKSFLLNRYNLKNISNKAFSIIEMVIVILVIGILIASLVLGMNVIKKARISSAQSLTKSSPIPGIDDNVLWVETSYAEKALGDGLEDGVSISRWNDTFVNKSNILITSVGAGPTYANTISHIPAIKFDSSSSSNYLNIEDAKFLNRTNYTIFILDKRMDNNSGVGNYLIGDGSSLTLGYQNDTSVIQSHGEGSSSTNRGSIESLSKNSDNPRVMTFAHSSSLGNKIYINAILANEDNSDEAKSHVSGLTSLAIGKGYNGEIGELVVFSRYLTDKERERVEDYLTQKWYAPNNRGKSSSCTNGIVTSDGCDAKCGVSIAGVSTTEVSDGDSGNFTCSEAGYNSSDTIPYSCSNGTLSSSGSCGCASGYILSSGFCVPGCAVETIVGTSYSGQSVIDGTVVTCDENNYDGSTLGTCSNGNTISGSCNCASGYISESGSCVLGCNVATIDGTSYSGSTVSNGTTVTCDQTHYDGSTLGTCSAGNAISGTCSCESGYNIDGGACKQQCTISSGTINVSSDVTVDSGSSSYDCADSAESYSGTITYACNNGSLSSVSGTCTFVPVYLMFTSGTSYTIPSNSGFSSVKVWAFGGGGGGSVYPVTATSKSVVGGGGGGFVGKNWSSVSGGETITYSIGGGGSGAVGNGYGANGGDTTVTFKGSTITAGGGKGGNSASNAALGGSGSGGSVSVTGGYSTTTTSGTYKAASGGGAAGGNNGKIYSGWNGGAGGGCCISYGSLQQTAILGLQEGVEKYGYSYQGEGGAGGTSGGSPGQNGVAFGTGGGGAGVSGGNGGNGALGGGGGGGGQLGSNGIASGNGGNGGSGVIVIKLY